MGEGRSPFDVGERCEFFVHRPMVDTLQEFGPAWKHYDGLLLRGLIDEPMALFEGLQRPGYESAFCFSGKPEQRFPDGLCASDPPDNQVFLVFVMEGELGLLVIFDWEWRAECPINKGHPIHWEDSFVRRIWPQP